MDWLLFLRASSRLKLAGRCLRKVLLDTTMKIEIYCTAKNGEFSFAMAALNFFAAVVDTVWAAAVSLEDGK